MNSRRGGTPSSPEYGRHSLERSDRETCRSGRGPAVFAGARLRADIAALPTTSKRAPLPRPCSTGCTTRSCSSVVAAFDERDRNRSRHLLHVIETIAEADALDGLVREPGRRLRHVGGRLSAAGSAGDLRRSARGAGLVTGPGVGAVESKAAIGLPACGPLLRRPARDLARRAFADLRGRRLSQKRCQWRSARAHDARCARRRRTVRHLEHVILRGTASDEFALNDFFVRSDHRSLANSNGNAGKAVRSTA